MVLFRVWFRLIFHNQVNFQQVVRLFFLNFYHYIYSAKMTDEEIEKTVRERFKDELKEIYQIDKNTFIGKELAIELEIEFAKQVRDLL